MFHKALAETALALGLDYCAAENATGHNMGGGTFIVEQRDESSGVLHRVVLSAQILESSLPWTALPDSKSEVGLEDGVTVREMGDGVIAIDQRDGTAGPVQRVVIDRADLESMLAWAAA